MKTILSLILIVFLVNCFDKTVTAQIHDFFTVPKGEYQEVNKSQFDSEIQKYIDRASNKNEMLMISAPTGSDFKKGTVFSVNVTFTKAMANVLDAWENVSLRGRSSYYLRYYTEMINVSPYSTTFVYGENEESTSAGIVTIPYQYEICTILPAEANIMYSTAKTRLFRELLFAEYDIEITATGYETRRVHRTSEEGSPEIFLSPQLSNVNLSGSVNLNNLDNKDANSKDSPLNVYSSKQISEMLGLNEEEIIKLIKSQKLKGKLIGDKYFVRKEDFNEFMKN